MRARRLVTGLTLAALVAAGCTASDDSGDGAGGADGDSTDGTDATDGTSGVSVAGVTDDTVRLGALGYDQALLTNLGIDADVAPPEPLMRAFVDAQNQRGGVAGRQVELAFEPFVPVGAAEAEAACVALTEDDPVFLAIGVMIGDTPLCFTEDHATPYLGLWGLSPERERRSEAPFVALEMADDRQRLAGIEALQAEGLLDGRVALYWLAADTTIAEESVKPALEAAGIDVVVETMLEDYGTDQAAADQAADVIAERIRVSGADAVLALSSYGTLLTAFQRAGWLPETILSTTQHGLSQDFNVNAGVTPETLERVTIAGQYAPSKEELADDPELQTCLEEYAASDPETPIDVGSASKELLSSVAQYCAAFRLFVQAAEAAGDELTPASWGAGAESLGDLTLPGIPFGSLNEDKHSVNDGFALYTYDAGSGEMVATGPPTESGV